MPTPEDQHHEVADRIDQTSQFIKDTYPDAQFSINRALIQGEVFQREYQDDGQSQHARCCKLTD